jgi:hypothetical protein
MDHAPQWVDLLLQIEQEYDVWCNKVSVREIYVQNLLTPIACSAGNAAFDVSRLVGLLCRLSATTAELLFLPSETGRKDATCIIS